MSTVTEAHMSNAMISQGGLGIIHRYNSIEFQTKLLGYVNHRDYRAAAIGVTGDFKERLSSLVENDLNIVDVKIYNTIGVMVYEQSFDSIDRFRELDLSNLISGVYVIKINSSIGKNIKKTQVYKFIKN